MGIFDRGTGKKVNDKAPAGGAAAEDADYYDSPVENVALGGGAQSSAAPARAQAAAQPQAHAAPHDDDEPHPSYGIEQAILLMRALPAASDQNVELVVAIVKTTLESLKVKVSDIIEDASRKQKDLEGRVSNLKQQIADFEKEIQTRKDEIGKLEADHAETTSVKGRLELAEKAQRAQKSPASVAKPIAAAPGSKA